MKKKSQKNSVVKMGTGLPVFNPHAADIDIGDTMHCVAISDGAGGHEVKATSAFTCDLHEIVDYMKKTQKDLESQKFQQAKIIMNESIFEDVTITDIASKLNTSYSSFRKLFKKHSGIAPAKYLNELKIRKAKLLLLESAFSIKEIACMLNGKNPDHFYTVFKKNTGETPLKFRLATRNKN